MEAQGPTIANTSHQVGILWTILTTVLFVFPPEIPVTPNNMNYCLVAFGVILLIAGLTWIFDGRKNYEGPKVDVQALMSGKVEAMDPVKPVESPTKPEEEMVERKRTETVGE